MSNFYIDNGININPAWEKHIAISTDGVRWETFNKEGLNVLPAIRKANILSPLVGKAEKCVITLTRTGETVPAFSFDVDSVLNQPTWLSPTTIIGQCITAVDDITTWLSSCCGAAAAAAGATEATLQLVLSAIQDGQDFEAKLVVDDNGDGDAYLEVRIWNSDTQTWETPLYYTAGSNTGVPAGSLTAPIIYVNPAALLSTIASNTTGLATEVTVSAHNNKIITDTDDGAIATDQVLPVNISVLYAEGDGVNVRLKTDGSPDNKLLVSSAVTSSVLPTGAATQTTLAALLAAFNAEDFATQTTLLALLTAFNAEDFATQTTLAALLSAFNAEDFASQTTLAALLAELQLKADLTETQPVSLATSVRTPSYAIVTATGAGSIAAGARSVSIKNNGAVPVTVLGTLLPVGESIGFDAGGQGDTLGAIAYNNPATGSLQIVKTV